MTDTFRLTLAQLDPTVGDIAGNAARARDAWEAGRAAGADMVALPEMFLTGYQTQDLVTKPVFTEIVAREMAALARDCADGPALGLDAPHRHGVDLFNAYYVLRAGEVAHVALKQRLPNEGVFDEVRLYRRGTNGTVIDGRPDGRGPRLGIPICEDAWHEEVCRALARAGADLLLVPNGSPYARGKQARREGLMATRVGDTGLPLAYLNLVGGQDDQVFDGASFVTGPEGLAHRMPPFEEAIEMLDFAHGPEGWRLQGGSVAPMPSEWELDYRAMVVGTRDYMRKTGFSKALLGLSGGIDSAIVATIAVDALGPENVRCVMLPSEYTSAASLADATDAAERLGVRYDTVPITGPRAAVTEALAPLFAGTEPGLTEENLQSRLRGLLLMALSNKFGEMLLTTGNKSEVAVGYATIYGDMNGGYNPIKDLYKTRVFETCRWRNANHRDWMRGPAGEAIPPAIIDKPPTAELREDQRDEDSLPPYDVLDAILTGLVDEEASVAALVARGFDHETVKQVEHLLYVSEYKRFQSAPGPRLTERAFWLDRRYPIVNRFRDPTGRDTPD
ncbi:MAG: NAD+ synthase [Shimia sp.]